VSNKPEMAVALGSERKAKCRVESRDDEWSNETPKLLSVSFCGV